MLKKDLINKIWTKYNIPKKTIRDIISDTIAIINEALASDDEVYISGFGIFSPYTRNGIVRRHPKTGKKIKIGNKIAVSFRAASALKRELNRKDSK